MECHEVDASRLTRIDFAEEDTPVVPGHNWAAVVHSLAEEARSLEAVDRRNLAAAEDSRRRAAGRPGKTGLERKT